PSCPALCRASTSFFVASYQDVDGRDEPGLDEEPKSKHTSLPVIGRRRHRFGRGFAGGLPCFFCKPLLLRDRQDQLRIVIGGTIDPRRHLMPGELTLSRPAQQRHGGLNVVGAAIKP